MLLLPPRPPGFPHDINRTSIQKSHPHGGLLSKKSFARTTDVLLQLELPDHELFDEGRLVVE